MPKEKGKRDRDLSGLAVTVIEHELAEEEQICPQCGNELHEMKTEVTKVLKLVPAHFEVEEHRRHVYTTLSVQQLKYSKRWIMYVLNIHVPGT